MPLVMCLQYLKEASLANPTRVHLEEKLIDDGMNFTGRHLAVILDFVAKVGPFEILEHSKSD